VLFVEVLKQVTSVVNVFGDFPKVTVVDLDQNRNEFSEAVRYFPQPRNRKKQTPHNDTHDDSSENQTEASQFSIIFPKFFLNGSLNVFSFFEEGKGVIVEFVIICALEGALGMRFCLAVYRNRFFVALEKNGELIVSRLWASRDIGWKHSVVGWVESSTVEVSVVYECLKILRGEILEQSMGIRDDDETLFPWVSRLQVLNVVLSVEHKHHLFVARNSIELICEEGELGEHGEFEEELSE
jgi:hypothetical protein